MSGLHVAHATSGSSGILVFEDAPGWVPRITGGGRRPDVDDMTPAMHTMEREAASHLMQATVTSSGDVLAATLERVAKALRGARARTGMTEERTVGVLIERGVLISVPVLRRAERTGVVDFALASCLADVYGTTTDCLAGRRPDRRQQSSVDFSR
jgi:hypothetical protein